MKRFIVVGLLCISSPAFAYDYTMGFWRQDLKVIGEGLDLLPRKETDANGLYDRMQRAITDKDAADQKAAQDAAEQIVAKKRDEIVTKFYDEIKAAILAKIAADKPTPPPDNGAHK